MRAVNRHSMIRLTRINQVPLVLNSDLIEHIEITPDTVITMTNGQKFVVLESTEQVIERVIAFRRTVEGACLFGDPARPGGAAGHRGGASHDAEGIR